MKRCSPLRLAVRVFQVGIAALFAANSMCAAHAARHLEPGRATLSFDSDWRFIKGDPIGAETVALNDTKWRTLNVPHDWSIEGPFDEAAPAGAAGGFLPTGIGWYRKHFILPSEDSERRVFVDFDGVMANSDIWINGFHLGKRPYGYVSFRYELTGHLNFGNTQSNLIAVRADNSGQPASRWYSGAGIYRHVRLVVTNQIHLENYGTFITTTDVTAKHATVHVQNSVVNQSAKPSAISIEITIIGPDQHPLQTITSKPQTISAGETALFRREITVRAPELWDIESPSLYRAIVRVHSADVTVDDEEISFGIRDLHFDATTGFWLNGRNLKIKGVCLHHDASALGAAVPLRAWERRLAALKRLGVNAIRTAHNPPAPEFLDLTDRMGFLVMDEMFDVWAVGKNPYDYHLYFRDWSLRDAGDTVQRDRNHASIVIYSVGNEIRDTTNAESAKQTLSSLVAVCHKSDPTRPVTQALFRPNVSHDYDDGLADLLDVVGQNYRENEILAAHQVKPSRKILGTENRHDREPWLALRDNPPYAGQFLWTGVDYLGEAHIWPTIAAAAGLLDRTGTVRPLGFQRQSWWSDQPIVYMSRRTHPVETGPPVGPAGEAWVQRRVQVLFSDWTPQTSTTHDEDVEVYSNCEKVELFLNGKSLGSQPRPADDSPRTWKVSFVPGTLKAVGINHDKTVATHELYSAGKPARILLTADRDKIASAWDDVSYLTATVVDENGVRVPDAANLIHFDISGPGAIIAVDSADNSSHEPFQATERHAFQGQCFAILRASGSPGSIVVHASAPGLGDGNVTLQALPPLPAASQ